jgi:hypothetical protein
LHYEGKATRRQFPSGIDNQQAKYSSPLLLLLWNGEDGLLAQNAYVEEWREEFDAEIFGLTTVMTVN